MTSLSFDEIMWAGAGVPAAAISNWLTHKPIISRLYIYPAFVAAGYFIGRFQVQFREKRMIERDIYLHDYISKHPEDFPELAKNEPLRYKDVLEAWNPIRSGH